MTKSATRMALSVGCALAAFGGLSDRAQAQAFAANPATQFGSVTYNRATPGVETITVNSPTAVILWRTGSIVSPFVFLPAGNVATFTNGVNNTDFVVLNRISVAIPSRFDGTVLSRLVDATGTSRTGGTVIFSSPGGLIVGPKAVFDVGSLVLTTLNVKTDAAGNFYDAATRGLVFDGGASNPNAAVVTQAGSQISALEQNSYVAMVAPVVQHGGSVRVNGSAAFIAGESVQMRVNQGLFDIVIDTGSANATPLVHSGTTGGPASTGAADPQAIYLVAMPKNQAITALLQGDIGFDPAVGAGIENGVIVLSAGANLVGGQVDRYGRATGTPAPDLAASFRIGSGTIRSDLFGTARTDMRAAGIITFQQDVSLFGGSSAHLTAGVSESVTVMGDALVSAAAFDSSNPAAFNLVGGDARIFTTGGDIHIFGNAIADASARGRVDAGNIAGSGTGGNADVSVNGGAITVDGNLAILATGTGGSNPVAGTTGNGGSGFGGTASLNAAGQGVIAAKGIVFIDAGGTATASDGTAGLPGATGRGGRILIGAAPSTTVTIAGALDAIANGLGGEVQSATGLTGGLGQGGTIIVRSTGGTMNFNGTAGFVAAGTGGAAPAGGTGRGGDLLIEATEGNINFTGAASGAVDGTGGAAGFAAGGKGGTGAGGTIQILAHNGAAASRIAGAAFALSAAGTGGAGGSALAATPGGLGGAGNGGAITILADSGNGRIDLGAVTGAAIGTGGAGGSADSNNGGGTGGIGTGGAVLVGTAGGAASATPTGSARFASLNLRATGIGGTGGFGRGNGGNGAGGSVALSATGAPVTATGATALEADGQAGTAGDSPSAGFGATGQGAGGSLTVGAFAHAVSGAAGALNLGDVTGTASGLGTGTGNVAGQWHLSAMGSNVTAANLTLTATTTGIAPGAAPASTIDPRGGIINVPGVASLTTAGDIALTAAQAGRMTGGRLNLTAGGDVTLTHGSPVANGVTIDVTDLFIRAGDDVAINPGAVTRASNATDIRAVDLATIAGRVVGRQIAIGSADIDLAATGTVGDAATEMVALEAAGGTSPPAPGAGRFTTIGGTAQGPGYTLTNAEAGRIRATTLRILAPALSASAGRAPDLIIRDLTLNGGGAAAGIGTLDIVSPGIARVDGNLLMAGARAQDGILFTATERLEVATPAGSIRVRDGAGAPGGTLRLSSNNIWIASAAIIDALRLNPNYAGRDDDLIDNDGVEVPRGYVEANGVALVSGGTLYVQNTGSSLPFSTAYAGITVGPGGLTITAAAPGTNVTAFGRRLNADGSFTMGDTFFAQSTYNTAAGGAAAPPGSYTPVAALNTCIIVTGQCGPRPPKTPLPGGPDPTTGPTGGSFAILLPAGADQDDLVDTSFAADPLIEEPVTSGSETSLWGCPDPDHDGDCDDTHD